MRDPIVLFKDPDPLQGPKSLHERVQLVTETSNVELGLR